MNDIIIIDNTKPLPPIFTRKPIPTSFKTTLDESRYWAEENRRSLEGYKDMPGTLYHKCQHQMIQNRYTGEILHPICRDVDFENHWEFQEAKKKGENIFFSKGRGAGFSVDGGCFANYHMKYYPGSNTLVTALGAESIGGFFGEKVMPVYNNYHPAMKPTLITKSETTKAAALKVAVAFKDEYGKIQYGESKITLKETAQTPKSVNAFSGKGAIFGFFDELPLHPRWRGLLKSSEYCFIDRSTGKRIGTLMAGGTFEETLTNEQILQFNEFLNETSIWNFRHVFIPFWKGMHMVNGHSNKKKADEEWEIEHDKRLKSKDPSLARAWRLNNPRTIDDILELTSGTRFKDYVSDLIREQIKVNTKEVIPFQKIKIYDHPTKGIYTESDDKPTIQLLSHPKPNVNYFAAMDGIATGTETGGKEGSKIACWIIPEYDPNGISFAPVALYLERPKYVDDGLKTVIRLCKLFDKYGNFKKIWAEGNSGLADTFTNLLRNEGLERFISYRADVSKKGYTDTSKPFQARSEYAIEYQHRFCGMYLEGDKERRILPHIQDLKWNNLLQEMLTPMEANTDSLDAFLQMFIGYPNIDKAPEKKPQQPQMPHKTFYIDSNGALKYTVTDKISSNYPKFKY